MYGGRYFGPVRALEPGRAYAGGPGGQPRERQRLQQQHRQGRLPAAGKDQQDLRREQDDPGKGENGEQQDLRAVAVEIRAGVRKFAARHPGGQRREEGARQALGDHRKGRIDLQRDIVERQPRDAGDRPDEGAAQLFRALDGQPCRYRPARKAGELF